MGGYNSGGYPPPQQGSWGPPHQQLPPGGKGMPPGQGQPPGLPPPRGSSPYPSRHPHPAAQKPGYPPHPNSYNGPQSQYNGPASGPPGPPGGYPGYPNSGPSPMNNYGETIFFQLKNNFHKPFCSPLSSEFHAQLNGSLAVHQQQQRTHGTGRRPHARRDLPAVDTLSKLVGGRQADAKAGGSAQLRRPAALARARAVPAARPASAGPVPSREPPQQRALARGKRELLRRPRRPGKLARKTGAAGMTARLTCVTFSLWLPVFLKRVPPTFCVVSFERLWNFTLYLYLLMPLESGSTLFYFIFGFDMKYLRYLALFLINQPSQTSTHFGGSGLPPLSTSTPNPPGPSNVKKHKVKEEK